MFAFVFDIFPLSFLGFELSPVVLAPVGPELLEVLFAGGFEGLVAGEEVDSQDFLRLDGELGSKPRMRECRPVVYSRGWCLDAGDRRRGELVGVGQAIEQTSIRPSY